MSGRHHGTGHFIAERVSAILLLFLTPWFLVSVALLDGGYDGARAWAGNPANAVGIGIFLLVALYHIRLGVQVILEDYLTGEALRVFNGVNTFVTLVASAVGVYALYSLTSGG